MTDALPVVGTNTPEFAAQLLRDLYVSLRRNLQRWAEVTHQTPQPRMGYVGQHLVSVVTGLPGGRSGARGDDLKLPNDKAAEIKCCYRVDQLGICKLCGAKVASIEKMCPNIECKSREIIRKDDSKWLLSPKSEQELRELFVPIRYYFVLFEFVDLSAADDIDVKIFTVDPTSLGFSLCMIDYYFNIRAKSKSSAPFNLWPHSLKFAMMKPELIYWSVIKPDDSIETKLFPGIDAAQSIQIGTLDGYVNSDTLNDDAIDELVDLMQVKTNDLVLPKTKRKRREIILKRIQDTRVRKNWSNNDLANSLARAIYRDRISTQSEWTRQFAPDLND